MTPTLLLLILACAFLAAGVCHLAIAIKRLVCAWLARTWSALLNQWAESVR